MAEIEEIKDLLTATHKLSDENFDKLFAAAETVSYRAGDAVIEQGSVDDNMYIVSDGILRGVIFSNNKENTLYFAVDGDMVASMFCYQRGLPSIVRLEACCDTVLWRIPKATIQGLASESIDFSNWLLDLATEQLYLIERKRLLITGSATERYEALVANRREMVQKIPLRYIASYLGIAQQSLSRLRNPRYKDGGKE